MKTKNQWPDAHLQLKQLYEERVPKGMSQREFGRLYGIGSQSMVAQYLNGDRPLSVEAAAKFAVGLRCTIRDISQEMADFYTTGIVPILGPKAWLRSTLAKVPVVLVAALLAVPPRPAEAFNSALFAGAFLRQVFDINTHWYQLLRRLFRSRTARNQGFLTGLVRPPAQNAT